MSASVGGDGQISQYDDSSLVLQIAENLGRESCKLACVHHSALTSAHDCQLVRPNDTVVVGAEAWVQSANYRYLVGVAARGITKVVADTTAGSITLPPSMRSFAVVYPANVRIKDLRVYASRRRVDFIDCNASGC